VDERILDMNLLLLKSKQKPGCITSWVRELNTIKDILNDETMNDQQYVRVDRFNRSALELINSLQNMFNYINTVKNIKQDLGNDIILRKSCRNVCMNIDMYIGKILTFIRYYFFMNVNKTIDAKVCIRTLDLFRDIDSVRVTKLKNCCIKISKDESYLFVSGIRNDEEHNDSPLNKMHYEFGQDGSITCTGFKITNQEIVERVVDVIWLLIDVVQSLQEIIDYIPEIEIAKIADTKNYDKLVCSDERLNQESKNVKYYQIEN